MNIWVTPKCLLKWEISRESSNRAALNDQSESSYITSEWWWKSVALDSLIKLKIWSALIRKYEDALAASFGMLRFQINDITYSYTQS